MHRRFSAALACAVACTMLLSSGAHAITAEPGGEITAEGTLTFTAGATSTSCTTRLSGEFNTAIEERSGAQLFALTSGTASGCSTGTVTLLFGSAWSANYTSFNEDARTFGVSVTNVAVSIFAGGLTCLYGGTLTATLALDTALESTSMTITGGTLSRVSGSGMCAATASVRGALAPAPAQDFDLPCVRNWFPHPIVIPAEPTRETTFTLENLGTEGARMMERTIDEPRRQYFQATTEAACDRLAARTGRCRITLRLLRARPGGGITELIAPRIECNRRESTMTLTTRA